MLQSRFKASELLFTRVVYKVKDTPWIVVVCHGNVKGRCRMGACADTCTVSGRSWSYLADPRLLPTHDRTPPTIGFRCRYSFASRNVLANSLRANDTSSFG